MKKLISVLLAALMIFSLVTVAFAEDTGADDTVNTENAAGGSVDLGEIDVENLDLGEFDWILDLPFWTVGPALKFAKIALKLVSVYLKVAKIFGLVEKDMDDYIIDILKGMIEDAQKGEQTEESTTVPPAEETTAPAAA